MSDPTDRPEPTPPPVNYTTGGAGGVYDYPPNQPMDPEAYDLLKKKTHAGRNLMALAVLATLFALIFVGVAAAVEGVPRFVLGASAGFVLIALGYWVLAFAARKGSIGAVTVVSVLIVIQLVLGVSGAVNQDVDINARTLVGPLILLLMLIALLQSRTVLVRLKARGLYEQAFPNGTAPAWQTTLGAGLLVGGIVVFFGGVALGAMGLKDAQETMQEESAAFHQLIQQNDGTVLNALNAAIEKQTPESFERFGRLMADLRKKVDRLQTETDSDSNLRPVLKLYEGALEEWSAAIDGLRKPNPDLDEINKHINRGNDLRQRSFAKHDEL